MAIKENILAKISEKRKYIDEKKAKYYKLDLAERVINRLSSFNECQECAEFIRNFESHIDNIGTDDKKADKEYNKYLNTMISHLTSKHKLVTENYYMSVFMPIGMMFGMTIGTIIMNDGSSNISIGISLGLCFGVAIGVSMDSKAKKNGMII